MKKGTLGGVAKKSLDSIVIEITMQMPKDFKTTL
jgi:hypothetical protein